MAARELLLRPSGPDGTGVVVLCERDPITGADHRETIVPAPIDAVLVVDFVFAFRPEYDEFWDYRIWLDVPAEMSVTVEPFVTAIGKALSKHAYFTKPDTGPPKKSTSARLNQ